MKINIIDKYKVLKEHATSNFPQILETIQQGQQDQYTGFILIA
jgi:hypothetical protein